MQITISLRTFSVRQTKITHSQKIKSTWNMKLQITDVTQSTADSITIKFEMPREFEEYKAGQHGLFTFHINGINYTRTYSFHTSPGVDKDLSITVRAIKGGLISNYLVNEGIESLDIKLNSVRGSFYVEPSSELNRHLIMFAGGSGITPIMSMVKSVLYKEPGSTISLVYSNRNFERIIFKDELRNLENNFSDRFKTFHVISESQEFPEGFNLAYNGTLSRLITKKIIKKLKEPIALPTEIYMCGPFGFMQVVEGAVEAMKLENVPLYMEHFFVPPVNDNNNWAELPSRKVIVRSNSVEYEVEVGAGKSILKASLEHGINLSYSCTEGQCGTCRAQVLRGTVKLRKNFALTEKELKEGQVLLCQSFPETEDVLVEQPTKDLQTMSIL